MDIEFEKLLKYLTDDVGMDGEDLDMIAECLAKYSGAERRMPVGRHRFRAALARAGRWTR